MNCTKLDNVVQSTWRK